MEQQDFFSKSLAEINKTTSLLQQKSRRWVIYRVGAFLAAVLSLYILVQPAPVVAFGLTAAFLGLLIYFAYAHQKTRDRLSHYQVKQQLVSKEIEAISGNYQDFDPGIEYQDHKHSFASDLDLFGGGSLFQMLNRAVTSTGKQKLADLLRSPLHDAQQIQQIQEAVKELSQKPRFMLDFLTAAKAAFPGKLSENNLVRWASEKHLQFLQRKITILLAVIPVITFIMLALMILGNITFLMFLLYLFLVPLGITGYYLKTIGKLHAQAGKQAGALKSMSEMLRLAEDEKWQSDYLKSLLANNDEQVLPPSAHIRVLSKISERFDYRLNFIAGFLLNAFLLWDLRQVKQLEIWKQKSGVHVEQWLDRLHRMEVLISQGLFTYHHPDFIFPEMDTQVLIDGKDVGHPFIPKSRRVGNQVQFSNWRQFQIITGGNMAGKSTYLRTVGINMVLAMTGNPVCAAHFRFTPVTLITSIRTDDSLQENESYFYAELKKLQAIIKRLEKGEKLFLLLDEILKGTNSRDKLHGSRALLRQLMNYSCSGAVATHDIALGNLEKDFSDNIFNYCFEISIDQNTLHFDYKLRKGSAENMNAVFLMKQMGITV